MLLGAMYMKIELRSWVGQQWQPWRQSRFVLGLAEPRSQCLLSFHSLSFLHARLYSTQLHYLACAPLLLSILPR